jgi:hypothetical protein
MLASRGAENVRATPVACGLIVNAARESAPRYDPRGWMHWPDNEDCSYRFMQVLGTAQEGSSTISECFLTATRVGGPDPASLVDR